MKSAEVGAPEPVTEFDYLLNAFERAAQADKPADLQYGVKRRCLFDYVRKLERAASPPVEVAPRARKTKGPCIGPEGRTCLLKA